MPAIPGLGRLKQENHEFEGTLGYIKTCSLKKKGRKRESGASSFRDISFVVIVTKERIKDG
jgi:hypothetical protein